MYEYEIIYKATGENDFLYGYSLRDLARRYPNIPPETYTIISREYIDWYTRFFGRFGPIRAEANFGLFLACNFL